MNEAWSWRIVMGPVLRRALAGAIPAARKRDLCRETWLQFSRMDPDGRRDGTPGTRFLLFLGDVFRALHRSLLDSGESDARAREIVSAASWWICRRLALIPWTMAGVLSRRPLRRVSLTTRLLFWFPFGAPSFDIRWRENNGARVAFDVLRCPLAAHFENIGDQLLCTETFCRADVRLAGEWNVCLDRSSTLVDGALCDFRWSVAPGRDVGRVSRDDQASLAGRW